MTLINYRSSKRAKALAIPEDVKDRVWCRDAGRCVWCRLSGHWTGYQARPEAHYIPRSKGGLGIPENVLTLCRPHHDMFDHGTREQREKMRKAFAEYLKQWHPGWDEEKLIYHKEDL